MSMETLTEQQVEQLKLLLLEQQAMLTAELTEFEPQSDIVELDQQLLGRVSRIDAIQQQNVSTAGRRIQQKRLNDIARALDKIAQGDYGVCVECDEPIAYERLKIKPEVQLCISCQSEQEQS